MVFLPLNYYVKNRQNLKDCTTMIYYIKNSYRVKGARHRIKGCKCGQLKWNRDCKPSSGITTHTHTHTHTKRPMA
jgi:hypothetical protein